MSQSICILGRQPALGLAELESLYEASALHPVGDSAVIVDKEPSSIAFSRLGGTIKLAKFLTRIDTTDWKEITAYLVEHVPKHTCCIPEGKLTFGISTYGLNVSLKDIERTSLAVKKVVKAQGRPVRVVPNKTHELNSAQVLHNKMTNPPLGMELLLIKNGSETLLAQTTSVQDIDAYAARDQKRPKRDARVGMLPPKLAQIIINLATAQANFQKNHVIDARQEIYERPFDILDPFCGTGVILQEALLMGYSVLGSDKDIRMSQFSDDNIRWLLDRNPVDEPIFEIYLAYDATEAEWRPFSHIAAETYLGRPFSHEPDPETLTKVIQDVDTIHKRFLENIARQTEPGFRMCIAVPAWHTKSGIKHLKMLDSLEKLGYNRVSFVHAADIDLIYRRPGQVVGRELVTLIRK